MRRELEAGESSGRAFRGGADYATNRNKESEHIGPKGHVVGHGLRVVLGSCHCD